MTITRTHIADYLQQRLASLASAVGQDSIPAFGFAPDIDDALRTMGKTESQLGGATLEDSQRDRVFALALYYAARRIWWSLSDRPNVRIGEESYNFAHLLANVKVIVDEARIRAESYGYNVTGSGWSIGHLSLDWIEPEAAD